MSKSESDASEKIDLVPLQGLKLGLATLAIVIPNFMNVLDTTIAVVSLPAMAGSLGSTPSQSTWILTSYTVCLAVVLPLSGWLSQRFGELQVFVFSILGFTLCSALCGMSSGFYELVFIRALQGFSGGLLLPLSQSLTLRIFPQEKKGLALGLWSLSSALAPVLGPILGGVITDNWGWPWIFFINIPFGLLSIYLCLLYRRSLPSEHIKTPVDFQGLMLLIGGIVCLQLALDRGQEMDWLNAIQIRIFFAVAVISLLVFVLWERDEPHPVVDLGLFRIGTFTLGSLLVAGVYITYITSMVLYPIWLQSVMGYTATWSGLVLAPTLLTPFVLMPLVGKLVNRAPIQWFVLLGVILMAYGMYLHGSAWVGLDAAHIAWSRVIIGTSMPFLWVPLTVVSLSQVPADKMSSATGLHNFMRMLGASVGTAVSVSMWDHRTIYHRSQLVESVAMPQSAMDAQSHTVEQLALLELEIQRQATTLSMNDTFYAMIVLLLLIAVVSFALPARIAAPPN
ncbi:MAG: DHA2 family efflux MFS transporter permease subunit [Halioglobus sp.]|nr:DHA2 family efflux MFS transporter permease subunit [Halioglobus sp.]